MSRLVCLLVVAVAAAPMACTRVVEQPPAPVVNIPPPPVRVPSKQARRPAPRPPGSTSYGAPAAGVGPAAPAAPRAYRGPTPEEEEAAKVMTLQRDKLQKLLDDALPTLTSCWGNETSLTANIAFEVTGAGKAENVRMPGAPEAAARCVADRVRALPLPTYTGPVLSIQIPVKVASRVETNKAAAAAGEAGNVAAAPASASSPAPAPKLFVNP